VYVFLLVISHVVSVFVDVLLTLQTRVDQQQFIQDHIKPNASKNGGTLVTCRCSVHVRDVIG